MDGPPEWLSRRLHSLERTGTLSLVREPLVDLFALCHPDVRGHLHLIKRLDLTDTNITSLKGIPKLPRLTSLTLDQSRVADLANIFALRSATSISLKGTPLAAARHYRLSVVLALGAGIVRIDGQAVPAVLRARADTFPNCAADLVNAGWVAEFPRPSAARFVELCAEFGIEQCDAADEPGGDGSAPNDTDDFDSLAEMLMQEHEALMQKKQAMFGVVREMGSDDGEIDECRLRIAMTFTDHGINIDINDDEAVLEVIDELCRQNGRVKGVSTAKRNDK
jgi:hypothetical protein